MGDIPPSIFIPIAEEANLIGVLGDWALKQACMDAAQLPGGVKVAVNVSAAQFSNPGFASLVAQALAHSELPPELLELELTESIFLGDRARPKRCSPRSSCWACAWRWTISAPAIPRSAISSTRRSTRSRSTSPSSGGDRPRQPQFGDHQAIVSMANAMQMDTTAEGIEAHDELDAMRKLGVTQIQGYIYAAAVSFEEVCEAMMPAATG
jgi:EAL domain-containing protein (putative c-di-GMP-specific phosphodiesterase class I)